MKYDAETVRRFAESVAAARHLPVSLVEKDVWLTYLLREIYSLPESKFLAFKGGTCLVKAYYGYYRFSEDIDLTWTGGKIRERDFRKRVIHKVMEELSLRWYRDEKVKTGIAGTQSGRVMNYFFLAPATRPIKLKVTVAFNEKLEFPLHSIKLKTALPVEEQREAAALYGSVAEDYFAPSVAWCYSLEEIACEKIRAILTRKQHVTRSRDIVDLNKISEDLGGLDKAAPPKVVKAKLVLALKNPSYKKEFERTTQNLVQHLKELAAQARLDPIFVEKPDFTELNRFSKELADHLTRKIL